MDRGIVKKLTKNFMDHKFFIAIICVIFITIAAVYYKKIVMPQLLRKFVENREFIPPQETDGSPRPGPGPGPGPAPTETATLYYFYTDWCPMCKNAVPELKALKNETNSIVNGVNIIFKDIDCDVDSETAEKFKITGYPTIKLVYRKKTYEYDAKPDRIVLTRFLTEIFKNPI
jgi:thiol-disulfide isomerase/thioredoxin